MLRLQPETEFCGMWGGSTLAQWRGRGLYRALTSYRARLALERGYRYARVDTSPDSRPILIGLGMQAVADTRPYLLDPARVAGERGSATSDRAARATRRMPCGGYRRVGEPQV